VVVTAARDRHHHPRQGAAEARLVAGTVRPPRTAFQLPVAAGPSLHRNASVFTHIWIGELLRYDF
jgi:hypothetical protein